jgi:hypothetical protein
VTGSASRIVRPAISTAVSSASNCSTTAAKGSGAWDGTVIADGWSW